MGLMPTRRETVALLAAAAFCPRLASAAPARGLDAIARAKGMRFGSAVSANPRTGSFTNPAYATLLRTDCGLLVAENEMKWQHVGPAPGRFDFAAFDRMLA